MADDTPQMRMIRRHARILSDQQIQYRGPRIGARERRSARDTARRLAESAGRQTASAARHTVDAVRPPSPPAR